MNDPVVYSIGKGLSRNTVIRRYIDLPKYIDLHRSHSLYFHQVNGFSDRFEGALTPAFRNAKDQWNRTDQSGDNADTFTRRTRLGNYASCWSLGANDNMALWQLYGGAARSVAITSTMGKLVAMACEWRQQVFI